VLRLLAYLLLCVAVAQADALVTRRPRYAPVVAFLLLVLVADVLRALLGAFLPLPPGPHVGRERVVFHVRQALFLVWPAALVAVSTRVFLDRSSAKAWVAYALLVGWLVVSYPALRGAELGRVYQLVEYASLVVLGVMVFLWWWTSAYMAPEHLAVVALAVLELGSVLWGPWAKGIWARWDLSVLVDVVGFAQLVVLQGVILWKRWRLPGE
jgi:hypothetical protein